MQTQEEILAAMAEIRVMAKGKVTVNRRSKSGKAYHSLQARKNGRNETRYVPEAKLAAVRAAIEAGVNTPAAEGMLISAVVIPSPHPELLESLL